MTRRTKHVAWLVFLVSVLGVFAGVANVPPTMEDLYVTTVMNRPVSFDQRAQDEDLNPLSPEDHPLRFMLLDGPTNGVLVGDIEDVQYQFPHDAVVRLTYVPATGFVGTDRVTLAVFDPFDETASGTVTVLIDVTEARSTGLLSGSWWSEVTFLPQSASMTSFHSQLVEVYRVGPLTVQGTAKWAKRDTSGSLIFDSLKFDGTYDHELFDIRSTLMLDPTPPGANPTAADMFDSWRTTLTYDLFDIGLRQTFYLSNPMSSSWYTLRASGRTDVIRFSNTLRLEADKNCQFRFARNDATANFRICGLPVSSVLKIACDHGFEQARVTLKNLALLDGWPGLKLNVGVSFGVEEKKVSASLSWRPSSIGCVKAYGQLMLVPGSKTALDGLSIYGVKLDTEIGGVRFVSATSFDPKKNSSVTGQTDYFEVVRLSGRLSGCCGFAGTWKTATYFHADPVTLFDWGMTTMSFHATWSEWLDTSTELVFRSGELGDPKMELGAGIRIRW